LSGCIILGLWCRLIGKVRNLQLVNLRNPSWMRLHLHWLGAMDLILLARIHLLSGFCVNRLLQILIPAPFVLYQFEFINNHLTEVLEIGIFLSFLFLNLLFWQEASLLDITNQACSLFIPTEVLLFCSHYAIQSMI